MTPQQQEHLSLLAIFHYVVAGLLALMACIPFIHLAIGLALVFAPRTFSGNHGPPPPVFVGWLLAAFAGVFILCGWTMAVLLAWSGRCLARRRHRTFCLVMAGLACLFMPLGTILGVFTIVLLAKPEVKAAFSGVPS